MTTIPLLPTVPPMEDFEARDYQISSIDGLREGMRRGHLRQILCAPTGSGKTIIAGFVIRDVLDKGKKAAFICDRLPLVKQTSDRFYEMGIPHGIVQAGKTRDQDLPIQICSAQTIEKRGFWPDLDLVVVDEAHTQRRKTIEFITGVGKPVVGLTATPFTKGLGNTYTNVVNVTTTDRLIAEGWLASLTVYAAKEINMAGAQTDNRGEWSPSEVERRGSVIVGDVLTEWQARTALHFGGPVKTIVFSATVPHGEEICRAFQTAGYNFQQISYLDRDDTHRERLIEAFRRGEVMGLVSCEALAKGFDVPDVLCLIGARPYRKSLAAHIQQLGRVMRSSPGKEFGLVLDHCGNYVGFLEEMLDFFAEGCNSLDDGKRQDVTRREGKQRQDVVCPCGYVLLPGVVQCPFCGRERRRRSDVVAAPGRMEEVTGSGSREWQGDEKWVWQQVSQLALERKGGDRAAAKKTAAGYYKGIYGKWPSWGRKLDPCDGPVDDRVVRKVKQGLIAWAKKDAKRKRVGV